MPTFLYDALTQTTFELERAQRPTLHVYTPSPREGDVLTQVRASAVVGVLERHLGLRGFALVVDPDALPSLPHVAAGQVGLAIDGHWVTIGPVTSTSTPTPRNDEITHYALLNAPPRALLGAELPAMLADAELKLEYLYATRKRLAALPEERIIEVQTPPADPLADLGYAIGSALDDELDLPRALAALTPFLKAVNELCDGALRKQGRVNRSAVTAAEDGFALIESLLGLGGQPPTRFLHELRDARALLRCIDPVAVEAKLQARVVARAAKDFATADRLQTELLAQGVSLLDHADGTDWTLTS